MFSDNGGQKCWDLSTDITKTSDPSPPTPNKVEFGAKWVKRSAFFGHNIARGRWGGGDDAMNPSAEQKNVLRSRILRSYCLQGLFPKFICPPLWPPIWLQYGRRKSTKSGVPFLCKSSFFSLENWHMRK